MRQEVAASTGRQWMILVMAARLKKSNPGARVSGCGKLGVALHGVFWSCGNQHVHPDLGRGAYPHLRLVRSGHVDAGDGVE